MNEPDLIQSSLFDNREFTVERDGITVRMKGLARSQKFHVAFENIPPKSEELTTGSKKLLIWSIIVSFLAVVCIPVAFSGKEKGDGVVPLFWGGIAVVLWFAFFCSRKSLIVFVQDGAGLVLLKDIPSPSKVEAFIKRLFLFRKDFLLNKYARFVDEESLESKLARLNFLRSQGVLTEQEYEFRRKSLTGARQTIGPLGFAP